MSDTEEDDSHKTPFDLIGTEAVTRIAMRFYAVMAAEERALADLHECDADGQIVRPMQEKFALFLIGWLGGPQIYVEEHGHPRLRMRHQHIKIDKAMRDAWLRCMATALDEEKLGRPLREFLDERFYGMADHLINC